MWGNVGYGCRGGDLINDYQDCNENISLGCVGMG